MRSVRKTARALLLNERNEILLMCVEGLDINSIEGTKYNRFWCTIGGAIDEGEAIEQAIMREIYEETGISSEYVRLGPTVWHSHCTLIFKGTLTAIDETYTVAKTTIEDVVLHAPTEIEKLVVKELRWWPLNALQQTTEVIFPEHLTTYLPDVIAGKYPTCSIDISDKK